MDAQITTLTERVLHMNQDVNELKKILVRVVGDMSVNTELINANIYLNTKCNNTVIPTVSVPSHLQSNVFVKVDNDRAYFTGSTYSIRSTLQKCGCKWDPEGHRWYCDAESVSEVIASLPSCVSVSRDDCSVTFERRG